MKSFLVGTLCVSTTRNILPGFFLSFLKSDNLTELLKKFKETRWWSGGPSISKDEPFFVPLIRRSHIFDSPMFGFSRPSDKNAHFITPN